MKLKSKAIAVICVIVVLAVIGAFVKKPETTRQDGAAMTAASSASGYILKPKESAILEYLLKDEVTALSNGGDSLFSWGMLSVSVADVSKAYNDNQVAADQKYFKKSLRLTGVIESINSGLGNEPYISMIGINQFLSPQMQFQKANIDKISTLKKARN
jgi:hypothetical protein